MNQKIKIVASIVIIGIIGKIIILNSPVYKFKVDSFFESKECKVISYSIDTAYRTTYCEEKISKLYGHRTSKEELFQFDIARGERDSCISNINMDRMIKFGGETDCYTDTYFDFLIFRTSDNKVISKGDIWAGADGFSKYIDTSIPNVGALVFNSDGSIKKNIYQVLFK